MKILSLGWRVDWFHLAKHVSKLGWKVIGLDNFNDYYDINLKRDREKY